MKKIKRKTANPIVDVVATASSVRKREVLEGFSYLLSLGFQPRLYGSFQSPSSYFFAQDERDCFKNLKKALFAKDSKIIWSLRGGYGSQRLLPYLARIKTFPKNRKVFIGFSDTTVLHDWIHRNLRWPTLHFPVLSCVETLADKKKIQPLITGVKKHLEFYHLKQLNPKTSFKKREIISQITGGNLTMIQSSIGTPWSFPRKNKILFLEDVNEEPYRIHRALWQMQNSGVFQGIQALIFGKWQSSLGQRMVRQVLEPFSEKCSFPVLAGLPCGHHVKSTPLPLGTKAELIVKEGYLKVKSPF